jgi:hypothetical protein
MTEMLTTKRIAGLLLLATATLGGCKAKEDKERYNDLRRLRVLALKSEPAELLIGETATLSALVYQPNSASISYQWSWCPSRSGPDGAYECALTEDELREIWEALQGVDGGIDAGIDGGIDFPAYDLGNEATAEFTHFMSTELIQAICSAWASAQGADESAALLCHMGLEPSVQLIVRSEGEEVRAIKSLSLPMGGKGNPEQRNSNPEISDALALALVLEKTDAGPGGPNKDARTYEPIAPDSTLRGDTEYKVTISISEDQAEVFLPDKREGQEPPTERKESLYASWFITMGEAEQRTSFVDDHTDFRDLLDNHWAMPHTPLSDQAQLFVVLRDERGGVGWIEHTFDVDQPETEAGADE